MNYMLDINKPRASTTPFTTARRPYPLWASANEVRTDGKWKYDSAVVSAQRSVGVVAFHASYTRANNTSNFANTTDPYNVTNVWTEDGARSQELLHGGRDACLCRWERDTPYWGRRVRW